MPYGDERNEKSDRKYLFLQITNYSFENFQNYFSNFGKLFINITSQKTFLFLPLWKKVE